MISTLDPNYFVNGIRDAFANFTDLKQSKKQNYIEVEEGMLSLITTSQFLSKGKSYFARPGCL